MTNTATQYRAYKGRNIDQMPLMLSLGVNPLSAVEFMRNRDAIFTQLRDVYANVSDLVAYGGKGASDEIKMILTMDNQGRITESGRKTLELINPKQERNSGAIVLSDELYDGFNGANVIKLSRKNLKKYGVNKRLTGPQGLNHPGWRALLRHPDAVPTEFAYDKGFMEEVVGRTFRQIDQNYLTDGMDFYFDKSEKSAKMRAWFIGRLEGGGLLGRDDIAYGVGCVVGVAP